MTPCHARASVRRAPGGAAALRPGLPAHGASTRGASRPRPAEVTPDARAPRPRPLPHLCAQERGGARGVVGPRDVQRRVPWHAQRRLLPLDRQPRQLGGRHRALHPGAVRILGRASPQERKGAQEVSPGGAEQPLPRLKRCTRCQGRLSLGRHPPADVVAVLAVRAWRAVRRRHYTREIAAWNIESGKQHVFGEEAGYPKQVMLIYTGTHYDALAIAKVREPAHAARPPTHTAKCSIVSPASVTEEAITVCPGSLVVFGPAAPARARERGQDRVQPTHQDGQDDHRRRAKAHRALEKVRAAAALAALLLLSAAAAVALPIVTFLLPCAARHAAGAARQARPRAPPPPPSAPPPPRRQPTAPPPPPPRPRAAAAARDQRAQRQAPSSSARSARCVRGDPWLSAGRPVACSSLLPLASSATGNAVSMTSRAP